MLELTADVPGYTLPASVLYCHPTRLADPWTPAVERVLLPARPVPASAVTVRAFDGQTRDLGHAGRTRNPLRAWRRRQTLDLPGCHLFDTRYDTEANIAHVLDNVACLALLARRELERHAGGPVDLRVLVRHAPAGLARAAYAALGLPLVATDANVRGRLVTVEPRQHVRPLYPALYGPVPLPADGPFPEKVYLARRGARALVNDAEVTALLAARGYQRVFFEDLPVPRQWAVWANARRVVAVHGAAMAAMAFTRHGGAAPAGGDRLRVVELLSAGYTVPGYRHSAAALGVGWCGVRGRITPEIVRDLDVRRRPRARQADPFAVSPETVELALAHAEGES